MAAVDRIAHPPPTGTDLFVLSARPIRLRWLAAAGLTALVALGRAAGADFTAGGFLGVAAFILLCNLVFHFRFRRLVADGPEGPAGRGRLAGWQAAADGVAVWALTCLGGGVAGPLTALFLVPVLFVSVLCPDRRAHLFCALVLAALALTALADVNAWLPQPAVLWPPGSAKAASLDPLQAFTSVTVWGGVLFAAAGLAATAARGQRRDLLDTQETAAAFSEKLQRIFAILETIGSVRQLSQVLETAVGEVAGVMQVKGASVKLLSEDGRFLHYAAAFGLPESMVRDQRVEVSRSPLNKRIIDGEPFVTGQVTEGQMFQFGETLSAARIRSVLFVPLHLDSRVIGILGAYCEKPDRFSAAEVDFFRLTARLVAIALDNARAWEALQSMGRERTWFMMKVAHNLRAPLVAMLSILEVVREGYLGAVNAEQGEYLRRLERRARTMLTMVNELMALSRNRERREAEPEAVTDPAVLARRVQRTFQDKAAERRIAFSLSLPPDLPFIRGRLESVEQLLENLVSNAIKYTPPEGAVTVTFSKAEGTVCIEVSDTGIGIGTADRPRLFSEFFRSEKAKAMEEVGTGLGLAIVKEAVQALGGRILVESEEGAGTIFVTHLPAAPAGKEASP
jgi:signal transduction histidine kinase